MRRAGSVVLVALALMALGAPAAHGGEYTVWSCADPDTGRYEGAPTDAPPKGWIYAGAFGSWAPNENCTVGGPSTRKGFMIAPIVSGGYVPAGDQLTVGFAAPPKTTISAVTLWRDLQLTTPNVFGGIHPDLCHAPCQRGVGNPLNSPNDPFSPSRRVHLDFNPPVTAFQGVLGCSFDVPPCLPKVPTLPDYTDASDFLKIYAAKITLREERTPSFAMFPEGSLLDTTHALAGVKGFSTKVTDEGGGLAALALEVDGQNVHRWPVASAEAPCVVPSDRRVPCPLLVEGSTPSIPPHFPTAGTPSASRRSMSRATRPSTAHSTCPP